MCATVRGIAGVAWTVADVFGCGVSRVERPSGSHRPVDWVGEEGRCGNSSRFDQHKAVAHQCGVDAWWGDKTSGVETPRADADVGQPRTPDAVEQPLPLPEQMEEPEVPAPPGVLPDASPDPLQAKRKRIVIGMQCTSACGVHHRLESGLLSRWEDGLPYCTKCLGRLRYKKKKREKETEQEGGKDADTV